MESEEESDKLLEEIRDVIIRSASGYFKDSAILVVIEHEGNVLDFSNLDNGDHIILLEEVLDSHKSGGVRRAFKQKLQDCLN